MIDIEQIRGDRAGVEAALRKRVDNLDLQPIVDLDEKRRASLHALDQKRAIRNQTAKQVGELKRSGENTDALQQRAVELRGEIEILEKQTEETEKALQRQLAELPNLPDDRVPAGGKEANQVLRQWGDKPQLAGEAKDHVELATALGLIDYERGVKLGGSGFWIYTGRGAALEWALLDFFCREHYRDGYEFVLPPHLLVEECGYTAGQFPKFRGDVFHLEPDTQGRQHFLLPTSETALLNFYRDEVIATELLPRKFFAYTPCYRREAGGYRHDERGSIRGHQFNKVEMFQFVAPEDGEAALDELVKKTERLVQDLGLHHQTSLLAAKDASASMAMTYDVEVWLPSIGAYKEVSSASWAKDYQARRANIRYRHQESKKTHFVHTLNASGLATSRLLPAILEQNQNPDGSVTIPEPLRAWLGTDVLVP